MPNVGISNTVASGSANITYDDLTPGTPQNLNSLNADFNGAGGANQNTNFSMNISPLVITIGGLGNANLQLTFNGTITDATFASSGGSTATPYAIPGTLNLTMQGTVSGTLVNILGISGFNLGLGTLFTLGSTTIPVITTLPGNMLLTDLGAGPFPHTMGVDLNATVPFSIPVPLTLPFNTSQTFTLNNGNHQNGFTSLNIAAGSQLNATMNLGNPVYDLNGTVANALVPEPSSLALASVGLLSVAGLLVRRRRAG